MINYLINKSLENIFLTVMFFVMTVGFGLYVIFFKTPIDALPDLSENQVVIMTAWPGQSPTNVEDQVTYPLTVGLQGLAGVKDIRAMSQLGISMVTVIFEDDVDKYFARDRISERLSTISGDLPSGVNPVLGPDATGLGQIYMYTLESENHSLTELRSLQDFTVKLSLQSVSGVAEVASIGGYKQTYQINVDKVKMESYNLSLNKILNVVKMSNQDVSGRTIDMFDSEIVIQGYGFYDGVEDIKNLVVGFRNDNVAIKVEDVADVIIGSSFRRGILADENKEKVGGIVVMRYGENPLAVTNLIKEKIQELETSLPKGVKIVSFYDRTDLIKHSVKARLEIFRSEIIIVFVVLFLFLLNFSSSAITVISLVVGLIMTFIMMYFIGLPSNIMSLGGIAVAIGTMVDSAIVVTENIYKKLVGHNDVTFAKRFQIVKRSILEVGRPIVFAIFIIILSFIPIFALQGMEGKLFAPLAFTNMFAMFGALIASLFLVPILCLFFLRGKFRNDNKLFIVKYTTKIYEPFLRFALKFRKTVLLFTMIAFIFSLSLFLKIGNEFMPPLDEGSVMYMPVTVPDVSEKRALELLFETNRIISTVPEVEKVIGKAGRADTATDPAPLSMLETIITLKPKSERRPGVTKSDIINEMNSKIRISNLWNGFTQPIIGRIDMLSTGIRTQVGIKVFGDDPKIVEDYVIKVEEIMRDVPGGTGVTAIRTSGLKYLEIHLDEEKMALYGINKSEVLEMIGVGFGGSVITTTIDGRNKYDVEVRLKNSERDSIDKIKSLVVNGRNSKVLLSSVADIRIAEGPAVINTENGMIRGVVQMNVSGIGLVEYVENGKKHLEQNLQLPDGYFVEWSGQYQNQQRAKNTLTIIVPIVILIILLILFLTYKDFGLVSIVALTIPFSLIGGFISLYISGFNVSVAVWVGFIALLGNAVETGVVMILYLDNSFKERFGIPIDTINITKQKDLHITMEGIKESIIQGSLTRLRPILMTALTSVIGLIPMLTSTGVGSELQKPLAIVVVGGLITSIFLTLLLMPVVFSYLRERLI